MFYYFNDGSGCENKQKSGGTGSIISDLKANLLTSMI
jgi:hypothetical protein